MRAALRLAVLALVASAAPALTQPEAAPVLYRLAFPAPEHHYAQVEATFSGLPAAPLEARMSRSSPGRYALHEFAKNVFDVQAFDGAGRPLPLARPDPYQWDVPGHDGTVRMVYKVFGNQVDGTYLGIDTSHAHMNMPATLMWARGLERREARVTFVPPDGLGWKPATQLFPTADPWTFTAPNFQYLMDSPVELSDHEVRSFQVRNPDGKTFSIVMALHHDAAAADIDEYAAGTERIVREQGAVFGEFPDFDTGSFIFLGDYLPWGGSDGMEHRNSTVVASAGSLRGNARSALDTVAHEFFHAWNVERIRPAALEPFDFERANMSGELWLAEGVTDYYADLTLARAGLSRREQTLITLANTALSVAGSPAHRFRSAVEMSRMAPFTDAARSVDPTNFSYSVISYYTLGSVLGLALDLELRARSNGAVTLDDYMRALWGTHGRPGGRQPGLVERPYTGADARARLAEVSSRAFADEFFDRYIEGRQVPDYARLLAPAGVVVRPRAPGRGWMGVEVDASGRIAAPGGLVAWGTPAFDAGLQHGDTLRAIDGRPFTPDLLRDRKPGERVSLEIQRPTGQRASVTVTIAADPRQEAVLVESTGATATAAQQAFRQSLLGSRAGYR
jgi:predicted metalloprotease with PDZ domain